MLTPVVTVATVPAIVAIVNLIKRFNPEIGAVGAVIAVCAGVILSVGQEALGSNAIFQAAASGLLLGLAAAGLYDLTPDSRGARRALEED